MSRLRRRGSVTESHAGAAGRFLPAVPRAPTGTAPAATAATTLPSRTSGATKLMTTDCVLGSVYGRLQPGSRPQRLSQGHVVFVVSKTPAARCSVRSVACEPSTAEATVMLATSSGSRHCTSSSGPVLSYSMTGLSASAARSR